MINIYHKYEEIINYLIVGMLTTIVSLFTYYSLTLTILDSNNPLHLQIANVLSWIFSVTFAYFTNRKYVFKEKNNANFKEALSFYVSRLSTLIIDMFLMFIFVTALHFNDKLVKIIVQVIIIILNYIFSKVFVFKKNK